MVALFFRSRNCGVRPILNLSAVARAAAWPAVISLFFFCLSASRCFSDAQTSAAEAVPPAPEAQIDLLPLGFAGLSAAARQSANITLDFLDSHHVLFTFNPKKLFPRLPECPPSHDDRLIHAMIVEVPGGKIVRETDWYLHDARRYVWPLGSGRVLVRRLNRLYEVDSNLTEKPVLDSPQELLWVSVTPDGKQIVIETSEEAAPADGKKKNKARVKISFLDADSLVIQRVVRSLDVVRLEATSSGFADVQKRGNVWLIRFGPVNIARVKGVPHIFYSSPNTMLIGRCSVSRNGFRLSAFSVTGNRLWREHWNDCRYSPSIRRSEDGSRFAFGTIAIPPPQANPSSGGPDSEEEKLEQTIQVFDTANGNSLISLRAQQAVLDGQNFSLSPDGRQLALIAGTSMKFYLLREMSVDERAKYIAVQSDAAGLYVPVPQTGKDAAEEPLYAAVREEEPAAAEQQSTGSNPNSTAPEAPKPSPAQVTNSVGKGPSSKTDPSMLMLRSLAQAVIVDVVVTDSKGQVVKGLQQADFTVAEDGKPQKVNYFREHSRGQAVASATSMAQPPVAETLPPNVFSNQSQPVEPGSTTVVLLDLMNTPLSDQAHAQAELVKFIKNKPKESQFALFTLANRLQMIQGFTQDGNILLAAASGKKASLRHRPLRDSDTIIQTSVEAATATAKFFPNLEFFVQSMELQESEVRVFDADQRMSVTVDAFAHLARYLSGVPGRKNLVWLSGSFQLGVHPDSSGQSPFIQAHVYNDKLKKAANLLAEAHVAVYPVDVKGMATDPLFSSGSNDILAPLSMQSMTAMAPGGAGPGRRVANTAVPIAVMQNQAEQFGLAQTGEHATMNQLAEQTGGRAFYSRNGIAGAINTATEEGSNYYVLSYTPLNKRADGSFRKISVLLAGKKYQLAYRSGYYAADPNSRVNPSKDLSSSLARAAMQQGSPQSRQVVFGVRVVPVGTPGVVKDLPGSGTSSKGKKKDKDPPVEMQRYSIDYAVVPTDLQFTTTPQGIYHDVLNFMITAFDDDGNTVATQVSQLTADLKPEHVRDIMLGGLRLHQEIDLPVKSIAMRVGVEDKANSHIGTLEIPLPVKAPPEEPAAAARKSLPPIEPD